MSKLIIYGAAVATVTAVAVLLTASAASAQSSVRAAPPTVAVMVDGSGIHAPAQLRPGYTRFRVSSTLPGTDALGLMRLNRGTTYAQILGYLSRGDLPDVFRHAAGKGGIAHLGVHNGSAWTARLTPGRYLYYDDEHHLVQPLRVAGAWTTATAPRIDGTIDLVRGGFRLPRGFGSGVWRLHNSDSLQHEFALVHIAPGHTPAEVMRAVRHNRIPSWTVAQGTVGAIGAGRNAWVTFTRLRGEYALMDYEPLFQNAASAPTVQFINIK